MRSTTVPHSRPRPVGTQGRVSPSPQSSGMRPGWQPERACVPGGVRRLAGRRHDLIQLRGGGPKSCGQTTFSRPRALEFSSTRVHHDLLQLLGRLCSEDRESSDIALRRRNSQESNRSGVSFKRRRADLAQEPVFVHAIKPQEVSPVSHFSDPLGYLGEWGYLRDPAGYYRARLGGTVNRNWLHAGTGAADAGAAGAARDRRSVTGGQGRPRATWCWPSSASSSLPHDTADTPIASWTRPLSSIPNHLIFRVVSGLRRRSGSSPSAARRAVAVSSQRPVVGGQATAAQVTISDAAASLSKDSFSGRQ